MPAHGEYGAVSCRLQQKSAGKTDTLPLRVEKIDTMTSAIRRRLAVGTLLALLAWSL